MAAASVVTMEWGPQGSLISMGLPGPSWDISSMWVTPTVTQGQAPRGCQLRAQHQTMGSPQEPGGSGGTPLQPLVLYCATSFPTELKSLQQPHRAWCSIGVILTMSGDIFVSIMGVDGNGVWSAEAWTLLNIPQCMRQSPMTEGPKHQ